jgi:hypothetical protein
VRYWLLVLAGLGLAGASVVALDWGIYHLVRTGTCASGGPYVSARPCPPGTGAHILALMGGIFGGLSAIGIWAARGPSGRPSRVGLGPIMWSLLFLTLAASVAYSAYGPGNNHSAGAHTAAIVLAVIFVPMGLSPLPLLFRGRGASRPAAGFAPSPGFARSPGFSPVMPPVRAPAPNPAHRVAATGEDDPLDKIAKLGELRDRGIVTPEEFEQQKRRLLGEL